MFIVRLDEAKAAPKNLAGLQSAWTIVGVAAFVATLLVVRRVRDLERYRWTLGFAGIGLLLLPLVPGLGKTINGARIWVGIGPVSFQPGEFAKILLALFFASYLVEKRELLAVSSRRLGPIPLPDPKHLGPVLLAWGASLVVMISQKDLGSSLLFFALFVALLWVATERATYLVVGLLLFAGGAVFAHSQFIHVQDRVAIWLDPWQDPKDDGFQIVEAQFAFSAGGVTGTGINLGSPGRIPYAETDFIFAAIGEELGLLGATAVLVAFLLMIGAGLRIALRTEVPFEQLLATGLTVLIGVQSFIIIAGVHPGAAAHRRHPAVRLLRRFVADRQLRAAGPAPAHLRRHRPPGGRAGDPPDPPPRARPRWSASSCCSCSSTGSRSSRPRQLNDNPVNTRAILRDFSQPRGSVTTADGVVIARSVAVRRPVRVPAGVPRGRRCSPTSPATSASPSGAPAWSAPTTTSWPAAPSTSRCQDLGDLFVDKDRVGDLTLSAPRRPPAGRRRAARRAGGLGGGPRPPHRRDPGPACRSRPTTPTCWPTTTRPRPPTVQLLLDADPEKPRLARTYQDRFFPGLDLQGGHRHRRHPQRQGQHRRAPSTR